MPIATKNQNLLKLPIFSRPFEKNTDSSYCLSKQLKIKEIDFSLIRKFKNKNSSSIIFYNEKKYKNTIPPSKVFIFLSFFDKIKS